MRVLTDFDTFINPNGDIGKLKYYYDYISFSCLEYCDYTRYLIISDNNNYLCDFVDLFDFPFLPDRTIYCINYLDNVCLQVFFDVKQEKENLKTYS